MICSYSTALARKYLECHENEITIHYSHTDYIIVLISITINF
nr:MAG TPA: hypothetical protein [Caudoviricetes sp.]DAT53961.1 MAG TPA: hypothetical protein [Caudoviricetes sp.]